MQLWTRKIRIAQFKTPALKGEWRNGKVRKASFKYEVHLPSHWGSFVNHLREIYRREEKRAYIFSIWKNVSSTLRGYFLSCAETAFRRRVSLLEWSSELRNGIKLLDACALSRSSSSAVWNFSFRSQIDVWTQYCFLKNAANSWRQAFFRSRVTTKLEVLAISLDKRQSKPRTRPYSSLWVISSSYHFGFYLNLKWRDFWYHSFHSETLSHLGYLSFILGRLVFTSVLRLVLCRLTLNTLP